MTPKRSSLYYTSSSAASDGRDGSAARRPRGREAPADQAFGRAMSHLQAACRLSEEPTRAVRNTLYPGRRPRMLRSRTKAPGAPPITLQIHQNTVNRSGVSDAEDLYRISNVHATPLTYLSTHTLSDLLAYATRSGSLTMHKSPPRHSAARTHPPKRIGTSRPGPVARHSGRMWCWP